MKEIRTEISISATPEQIWTVLSDFKKYADWNPFIRSISGKAIAGEILNVSILPPGGSPMHFRPVVLCSDAEREFRWKGKLIIKGLFDGEHYFLIRDNGDGSSAFIQGEKFSGLLVPMVAKALENTEQGFKSMNEALKLRCEQL